MIARAINEITERDIQNLRDAGIVERKGLEYKRELPGTADADKREFLADASSFANTEGGDFVFGVNEDQGAITDIVGLLPRDWDAEILRLTGCGKSAASDKKRLAS
jgi:predicted HTH transcriptional regulator